MKTTPIVLERIFDASVSKVWKAISDKNEMKLWYFDLEAFKPEIGFKFQFIGCKDENTKYLHLCEVTEVEQEKKLTYSWSYDGYEGISFVTFELFPKGNKTLLRLTHKGLESFPKSNLDFAAKNFAEGWDSIIQNSLKDYLEI